MNSSFMIVILAAGVAYGTPLLYAALGELLAERSGVVNLGVEGMMLVGAVMGFWAVQRIPGSAPVVLLAGVAVAALAGALMSLIHAFIAITLKVSRASQFVSGLALTLFAAGDGLSSYLGDSLQLGGVPAGHAFKDVNLFGLQELPVVGPIVFGQSALVYASWVLVALIAYYLKRTRPGLNVRSVGEAPKAADTAGINVVAYRYVHVLTGGALAGIAGATYSLSLTPQWVGGGLLTGGAGWIAIALVIFAFWRPGLCLVGAYLFGTLTAVPPNLQARAISFAPSEVFQALPYLMAVLVVAAVSSGPLRRRLGAPAALALPYEREER
jgi:ABC-type uncharacterized transport system permease subunit